MAVEQELVLVDHPHLREGPRMPPSLCWARLWLCSPTWTQTLVRSMEHHPRLVFPTSLGSLDLRRAPPQVLWGSAEAKSLLS